MAEGNEKTPGCLGVIVLISLMSDDPKWIFWGAVALFLIGVAGTDDITGPLIMSIIFVIFMIFL